MHGLIQGSSQMLNEHLKVVTQSMSYNFWLVKNLPEKTKHSHQKQIVLTSFLKMIIIHIWS